MPVLMLRLPPRASSEAGNDRDGLPSPEVLPSAFSGADMLCELGDFEPAERMLRPLTPWKSFLYWRSGLLGGLGGRAGCAACLELVVDGAGDAGVMAKVAACVRTGELGRGDGEKSKAFETTEGVVGCEYEPMGKLKMPSPGRAAQVLLLLGLGNLCWCKLSVSDSSVSVSWGEEDVKSGTREGEREVRVPSSEELRGLRSRMRGSSDGESVPSCFEPVMTILSVLRWSIPALARRPRPRSRIASAVDFSRIASRRKLT
jgi:hypothetical protein